jgi:hydroxymethylpyrimidine pyrophosphatase-like HAD family hydrolase
LEAWEPANAFSVTQALTFCIELIPANHNKGTALITLLNHLNSLPDAQHIDPANVITFGDGENDISMFKVAGMSVAMGNAMPVAKANARWQTGTNDEGGLGNFLESILFTDV